MRTCMLALLFFTAVPSFAQIVGPTPTASPTGISVDISPTPPAPPAAKGTVPVAEPAAPPSWAQDLMVTAEKLPVLGPLVTKALLYLGIISSILTMLVAFLLAAINSISGVLKLSGLAQVSNDLLAFKDSKFMYWVKYLSMFNAQKPDGASAEPLSTKPA